MQLVNAEFPIDVTEFGISTFVNESQSRNRKPLIVVNPSGKVISLRAVMAKASMPIVLTDDGIVISVKEEHSAKACSPIISNVDGKLFSAKIRQRFQSANFSRQKFYSLSKKSLFGGGKAKGLSLGRE